MNIFHKIALQGLKKNRAQTIVTMIGVILSAAMITAVATFVVSLQNYMVNGAIVKYGDWHVCFSNADASFVQEQAKDDRVEKTADFTNIGYAMLKGGKNPDKPYLFLAGFSPETFDALPVNLVSGRLPENSGEILVPEHVATNGGVKISVGDTLCLTVGDRMNGDERLFQHDPFLTGEGTGKEKLVPVTRKTYTVVGICQRPAFEEHTAPGYTLITMADAQDAGDSFSMFVTLKKAGSVRSYPKDVAGNRGWVLNDDVLRFLGLSDNHMVNHLLYSAAGILIALIMLGSVFLIYNSFHISLNNRMRQFGILLSVGATEKQIRNSVLFEGICIGLAAIPAGICIGIPGVSLVLVLVSRNFRNIMYDAVPLSLSVSVPALIAAAVVSMITILISAYIPARKAAGTPVMECIRQTNEVKAESGAVKTSGFETCMFGLERTLALKNFRRNKRRYRSIVLSLTLSVVLFVSASTFGAHLKQEAAWMVVDLDCDICFSTEDMDEGEFFALYDALKNADGVYESWVTRGCSGESSESSGEPVKTEMKMSFRSENPAKSVSEMKTIISAAGVTSAYGLYNYHEIFEEHRNLLFIVNLFTTVFVIMISLIGIANVFNTISTNIRLRRRELAMLRSVGMSDRDFNKMMRFECVLYGLRTLLFGLPIAGLLSLVIHKGMVIGGFDADYIFPWESIGISVFGVFCVICISMVYAAGKIKKENIIEALRDDMT